MVNTASPATPGPREKGPHECRRRLETVNSHHATEETTPRLTTLSQWGTGDRVCWCPRPVLLTHQPAHPPNTHKQQTVKITLEGGSWLKEHNVAIKMAAPGIRCLLVGAKRLRRPADLPPPLRSPREGPAGPAVQGGHYRLENSINAIQEYMAVTAPPLNTVIVPFLSFVPTQALSLRLLWERCFHNLNWKQMQYRNGVWRCKMSAAETEGPHDGEQPNEV